MTLALSAPDADVRDEDRTTDGAPPAPAGLHPHQLDVGQTRLAPDRRLLLCPGRSTGPKSGPCPVDGARPGSKVSASHTVDTHVVTPRGRV